MGERETEVFRNHQALTKAARVNNIWWGFDFICAHTPKAFTILFGGHGLNHNTIRGNKTNP